MTDIGRPEFSDDTYHAWLDDMRPFLKMGHSLHFAMEKAWIIQHKNVIYQKYRLNDWFRDRIDSYRSYFGEIVNSIFARQVYTMEEKQKRGETLTDEDWRNLRFIAERHKSCQSFFVNRQEVIQPNKDEIEKILDTIEAINYEEVAKQAKKDLSKR